jgi:hypothetical protein
MPSIFLSVRPTFLPGPDCGLELLVDVEVQARGPGPAHHQEQADDWAVVAGRVAAAPPPLPPPPPAGEGILVYRIMHLVLCHISLLFWGGGEEGWREWGGGGWRELPCIPLQERTNSYGEGRHPHDRLGGQGLHERRPF